MDQKGLAAMPTTVQPAGITAKANLRNSAQARKCASENSTLALQPRTDVNRSPKQGISGPTEKTYVLQKFNLEKSCIV